MVAGGWGGGEIAEHRVMPGRVARMEAQVGGVPGRSRRRRGRNEERIPAVKRFVLTLALTVAMASVAVACDSEASSETNATAPPPAADAQPVTSPPTATPPPPDTPTSQPTATATPTTFPTATPTPGPGPADYDHDRFAAALAADPPDLIQATTAEQQAGGPVQRAEIAHRESTGDAWMRVTVGGSDDAAWMELLIVGERTFVRGKTAAETIDWLAAPNDDAVTGAGLAGDLTPGTALAEAPLTAVAVEACGEGRSCFVLENTDDPSSLLLVDTQTYLPVAMRSVPAEGEAAGTQVDLIWGGEFEFVAPADVTEVTEEELALALFTLLLGMAATEDEPAPSPTPLAAGDRGNRAEPLAIGSTIELNGYSVEVVEFLRGDAALENLLEANSFNGPPAAGMEYVQVHLTVANDGSGPDIGSRIQAYRLTGSSGISFEQALVFQTEPGLDIALGAGETADGWLAFEVAPDETDLILVFGPFVIDGVYSTGYLALEPGASVVTDRATFPEPTDVGLTRAAPAPIGVPVVSPLWELTVLEARRGGDLLADLQTASPFIDPPDEGYEYLAVRMRVRHLGPDQPDTIISKFQMSPTGSENILYDVPFADSFEPELLYTLYPGAVVEGWATYLVLTTDTNLSLRFGGPFGPDPEYDRFMALEPGASVPVPTGALAARNEVGVEPGLPAGIGDVTVGTSWQIELVEVVRGPEALDAVLAANDFNDPPDDGTEYLLLLFDMRNIGLTDAPRAMTEFSFRLFDASGAELDMPFITVPSPGIDVELFPGGQHRGWIVFAAPVGAPGLTLTVDPDFFSRISGREAVDRYFAIP